MTATDSLPQKPSASLFGWSLVRLTMPTTTSVHGVGIIGQHPLLATGEPGITTRIVDIAPDRSWLQSVNRRYALFDEIARQEKTFCRHIVLLIYQASGGVADRMEWLAPDGATYLTWKRAELIRLVKAVAASRAGFRLVGHQDDPNAADDLS